MPHGACLAKLSELFPALFTGPMKPLKLRIQADIQTRAPGVFTKADLSAFFRRYTGSTAYLNAVAKGAHRFDLDGAEAGELSDEHRQVAQEELKRRRGAQQAQREQAQAELRQRAQLLRDFETTRLTAANFCALKGIDPAALDGLLAQAREEARLQPERAPQRHERNDRGDRRPERRSDRHHGHRGDRR